MNVVIQKSYVRFGQGGQGITYPVLRHSFKIIYGQWALKINVVSSFEEVNFFYVAVHYALLILILCKDACKCFNYFF